MQNTYSLVQILYTAPFLLHLITKAWMITHKKIPCYKWADSPLSSWSLLSSRWISISAWNYLSSSTAAACLGSTNQNPLCLSVLEVYKPETYMYLCLHDSPCTKCCWQLSGLLNYFLYKCCCIIFGFTTCL